MIEGLDLCCLPFVPDAGGYRLDVNGTLCRATYRRGEHGARWVIRGPGGRVLGAGRTVAAALRIARMVLEDR